jgi:predicted SprT family Zn-dependent metalloprotease
MRPKTEYKYACECQNDECSQHPWTSHWREGPPQRCAKCGRANLSIHTVATRRVVNGREI